jgi:hypothetical protein
MMFVLEVVRFALRGQTAGGFPAIYNSDMHGLKADSRAAAEKIEKGKN